VSIRGVVSVLCVCLVVSLCCWVCLCQLLNVICQCVSVCYMHHIWLVMGVVVSGLWVLVLMLLDVGDHTFVIITSAVIFAPSSPLSHCMLFVPVVVDRICCQQQCCCWHWLLFVALSCGR